MYKAAKQLEGTPYNLNWRTDKKPGIDCSGFVCEVAKAAGYKVSGNSENILLSANNVFNTNTLQEKVSLLQEGDVIAIDSGEKSFDKGRKYGVDHIGIIVQNNGKLFLAESTLGKGSILTPIEEGLKRFETLSKKSGKENSIFIGRGLPEK